MNNLLLVTSDFQSLAIDVVNSILSSSLDKIKSTII